MNGLRNMCRTKGIIYRPMSFHMSRVISNQLGFSKILINRLACIASYSFVPEAKVRSLLRSREKIQSRSPAIVPQSKVRNATTRTSTEAGMLTGMPKNDDGAIATIYYQCITKN
uniref:30S ribosomal protein S4 n=1 Tax=Lygus hesperus TaxID=30085 RepID=A0A0A9XMD2_LYGHE